MVRIFLAIVGPAYPFAAWCSLMPEKTSMIVGFTLQPGSGQSEFLNVDGGLELALGIAFSGRCIVQQKSLFRCCCAC